MNAPVHLIDAKAGRRSFHWLLASVFAIAVAVYSIVRFDGNEATYRLWYYVPAAWVVGSLVADRWERPSRKGLALAVEGAVIVMGAARPLFGWPDASGHAVFALFAGITGHHGLTRVSALVLLLITLYAKIVLWHWDVTLWPGVAIGLAGGLGWRIAQRSHRPD